MAHKDVERCALLALLAEESRDAGKPAQWRVTALVPPARAAAGPR
jgi:hypothetical protein